MTTNSGKLFIYKASAGAGKTEKLSRTYSELLLDDYKGGDREAYKHTLAVTFTNAATAEMKDRILAKLDSLAKTSDNEEIRKHASDILRRIVHDYSMFKVSTIDSFFQTVLRSVALELGRKSAYELSLDKPKAIEEAVGLLYAQIGTNPVITDIIQAISQDNLDNGATWDFRKSILSICKTHLKTEPYFKAHQGFSSKKQPDMFAALKVYNAEIQAFTNEVRRLYSSLIDTFNEKYSNLSDKAFARQSASWVYKFFKNRLVREHVFINLKTGVLRGKFPSQQLETALYDKPWAHDKASVDEKAQVAQLQADTQSDLDALRDLYTGERYKRFLTYSAVKKNLKTSFLLEHINREIEEWCEKEGVTLLADAPYILNGLLGGERDTPFVYEKTGTRINHYLLDEFQDTSTMQWHNFKPLLQESLGKGYADMIVGDIKQSIYRFRGGDWSIFQNDLHEFDQFLKDEDLEVNYRSLANIVEFNNALFSSFIVDAVAQGLKNEIVDTKFQPHADKLKSVYRNAAQRVSDKNTELKERGYVEIIHHKGVGRNIVMSANDFVLKDLLDKINGLVQNCGCGLESIGILVSGNSEGSFVANYLVTNGINVVSADSLKLADNRAIVFLISVLQKINAPDHKGLEVLETLYDFKIDNKALEDNISSHKYASLSIYEMCENILNHIITEDITGDLPYVQSFMDQVLKYSIEHGRALSDFLAWWDETADKMVIPAQTDKNAVTVSTMHKAKGLAYDVVFVPFLRDDLFGFGKKGQFWSSGKAAGIDWPVLLDYNASLKETAFAEEYVKELVNNTIDSLNLAYVTFTRPRKRLYIYAMDGSGEDNEGNGLLANKLWAFCCNAAPAGMFGKPKECEIPGTEGFKPFEYETASFGNGAESLGAGSASSASERADTQAITLDRLNRFESARVELAGAVFGPESENGISLRYEGILWHKLYSFLGSFADGKADEAVAQVVTRFEAEEPAWSFLGTRDQIAAEVLRRLKSVAQRGWFSDSYTVLNEAEILDCGKAWRPDRVLRNKASGEVVVVDYKFGDFAEGPTVNRYRRQVANYKALLSKLYRCSVRGYLWFVLSDRVLEV